MIACLFVRVCVCMCVGVRVCIQCVCTCLCARVSIESRACLSGCMYFASGTAGPQLAICREEVSSFELLEYWLFLQPNQCANEAKAFMFSSTVLPVNCASVGHIYEFKTSTELVKTPTPSGSNGRVCSARKYLTEEAKKIHSTNFSSIYYQIHKVVGFE